MTTKKFSNALGNIGEHYVNEAAAYSHKRKKSTWVKWVSMAACLSLIIAGGLFGNIFNSPDTPDNSILSYFVITAQAANGEITELGLHDSCFNSGTSKENVFGVDMPLFNFSVKPSNLKDNEAIYSQFDISVSYNGTTVGWNKDKHIMVAYLIPTPNSDETSWSYSISGWFDEPTNIIVNIVDKESREIVETITVNVNYDADRRGYDLEITNLTTKFNDQREAVEASNALMEYFYNQGYVNDYPVYFGGCYIESNKLYVKLVSPTDEEMKNLTKVLAHYDDVVVYKDAKTSMADLQEYSDMMANELMTNGYAVTSWYVDSITGNIVISVLEKDFDAVTDWASDISKNKDLPTIIIEKGGYIIED